jgi:predicted nuclease with TOPRIM domain
MSTEIITSLIIASSSIICQLLINASNRKKLKADNENTKSLIVYRIDKLEQKQDKYNHLQERVFNLEKNSAVTDEEIKVANHRIADLEKK